MNDIEEAEMLYAQKNYGAAFEKYLGLAQEGYGSLRGAIIMTTAKKRSWCRRRRWWWQWLR